MNKRLLSAVLATAMGVTGLAGCARPGASDRSGTSDVSDGEEIAEILPSEGTVIIRSEPVEKSIRDLSATEESDYRQGYLDFTFNLLNGWLAQHGTDSNAMVSPASVMLALDMAASGAAGDTLTQITGLYGGASDPQGQLSYAAGMMERLNDPSREGVSMHVANSMWINSEIMGDDIKQDYIDFVQSYFDAEEERTVFDSNACGRINGWVNDKTDGMIPTIIDDLDPLMAMMLINAIAFDGSWASQYEESQVTDGTFTSASGAAQDATMLTSTESTYLENDIATGFVKYYEGYDYAFVVMLPKDESMDAGQLLASFDGTMFDEYMNSATTEYDVNAQIPEFSYDCGDSIKSLLGDLGMNAPFHNADFSGMAEDGLGYYIGDVVHKTFIEVSRTGTRAAAVTAVMLYRNAIDIAKESKEVICDRPFAYAIVDMNDNTPVFIGTVNEV